MSQTSAQPAAAAAVIETSDQNFARDVLAESQTRPVIVDFWAAWCAPCRSLAPLLEAAVQSTNGAVRLAKLNIEEHPAIAAQLGVRSIPAVFAFARGRPVDGFVGALPEDQVKAFVARLAGQDGGAPGAELIEQAEAALKKGEAAAAAQLFGEALAAAPGEARAIAGLARCYIETGDLEKAARTLDLIPPAQKEAAAAQAARAMLALAEKSRHPGAHQALEASLQQNPADHQARFDLALALNGQGRKAEAMNALLEIIRRDSKWNQDAARRQLIEFFEAYGAEDEAVIAARRALSALLFR